MTPEQILVHNVANMIAKRIDQGVTVEEFVATKLLPAVKGDAEGTRIVRSAVAELRGKKGGE